MQVTYFPNSITNNSSLNTGNGIWISDLISIDFYDDLENGNSNFVLDLTPY